jgi:hypothetical protein
LVGGIVRRLRVGGSSNRLVATSCKGLEPKAGQPRQALSEAYSIGLSGVLLGQSCQLQKRVLLREWVKTADVEDAVRVIREISTAISAHARLGEQG